MLSTEIIATMMDYHYRMQRRLWECIMALTEEQFAAELTYSRGSVHHQMVHLANTDSGWVRGLKQEPNARSARYDPAEHVTRESVKAICDQTAEEVMAYVATLDEAALQTQPPGMPMPVWETLLHLVNHGTDHRAQVLRALEDYGAPTFEQDLVFYALNT